MQNLNDESPAWQSNPTKLEVHESYLSPQMPEHWIRIKKYVLEGGFGVEPNPHEKTEADSSLPEFKVTWPSPETKKQDYAIFFEACKMIIGTLNLDDEIFANSTTPQIFLKLSESTLFTELYSKHSKSQGQSVQHHVETVPTLVKTNGIDLKERFILRTTAVFHDIGKAFNIGRDQVHYHALISSNIVSWFMDEYKHEFVNHFVSLDNRSQEKIISQDAQGNKIEGREKLEIEFCEIRNQISETIRLHHVLEQIDKGVLDIETVVQIFIDSKISSATYGLFAIADGSSVITDKAIYAKYLINNINYYFKLLEAMTYKRYIESDEKTEILKEMYSATVLNIIRQVIDEAEEGSELLAEVKGIVNEISDKIDPVLATALLSIDANNPVVS